MRKEKGEMRNETNQEGLKKYFLKNTILFSLANVIFFPVGITYGTHYEEQNTYCARHSPRVLKFRYDLQTLPF